MKILEAVGVGDPPIIWVPTRRENGRVAFDHQHIKYLIAEHGVKTWVTRMGATFIADGGSTLTSQSELDLCADICMNIIEETPRSIIVIINEPTSLKPALYQISKRISSDKGSHINMAAVTNAVHMLVRHLQIKHSEVHTPPDTIFRTIRDPELDAFPMLLCIGGHMMGPSHEND